MRSLCECVFYLFYCECVIRTPEHVIAQHFPSCSDDKTNAAVVLNVCEREKERERER